MFRTITALLLLPVTGAYLEALRQFFPLIAANSRALLWPGAGLLAYIVIRKGILRSRQGGLWDTFQHELTHAVFCLVLFVRVHRIEASDRDQGDGFLGCVVHDRCDPFRGALISLAPYFFPTLTVVLVALRAVVAPGHIATFDFFIGVSLGYYTLSLLHDFGFHQDDIRNNGWFLSCVVIVLLNHVILAMLALIIRALLVPTLFPFDR